MFLPIEMISHIYICSDIDTKCSLNKLFGMYFFKSSKVSHPPNLHSHIHQQSHVIYNRLQVLHELLASIDIVIG